jgi:hypothetical protein
MEKTKEIIDYLKFSTKLRVLRYAKDCGKNDRAWICYFNFFSGFIYLYLRRLLIYQSLIATPTNPHSPRDGYEGTYLQAAP